MPWFSTAAWIQREDRGRALREATVKLQSLHRSGAVRTCLKKQQQSAGKIQALDNRCFAPTPRLWPHEAELWTQ